MTTNNLNNIPHPLRHVDAKGLKWHPYSVDFESPDGKFSCYVYAISDDHAELQLQALKETGRIAGQVEGVYKELGDD